MELTRILELAGFSASQLNEALEITGKVEAGKPNLENEVKDIRSNRNIAKVMNDCVASHPVDLGGSGKAVLFSLSSGAQVAGIMFSNNAQDSGAIKYDTSDQALDKANSLVSSTPYRFYQFKTSVIIGAKE